MEVSTKMPVEDNCTTALLPSLIALKFGDYNRRPGTTGKSWGWDPSSYGVRFSIDIAISEQIDGLGSRVDGAFVPPNGDTSSMHQLSPFGVLQAVREYTIQRIWDIECAVPRLQFSEDNRASSAKKEATGYAKLEDEIPDPSDANWLIHRVARWVLAVHNTPNSRESRDQRYGAKDVKGRIFVDGKGSDEEVIEMAKRMKLKLQTDRLEIERTGWVKHLKGVLFEIQSLVNRAIAHEFGDVDERYWENDSERDYEITEYLVSNKYRLTTPEMSLVRTVPLQTYYDPRRVNAERYVRWVKMQLVVKEGENTSYNNTFRPSALLPPAFAGSFYSGKDGSKRIHDSLERVQAMHMEHLIPRSHMKNSRLIKEFGHPEHLALNTVFAFSSENSAKGDKFLPLAHDNKVYESMMRDSSTMYTSFDSFDRNRRCYAARGVCAGYLTLAMLERKPDPNTELGAREGSAYYANRRQIFRAMHATIEMTQNKKNFNCAWLWEVGLALLQWFYLDNQPYNPLPDIVYRLNANTSLAQPSIIPFYKHLISKRFRNSDVLSEVMRREMMEEVPNAPLSGDKGDLEDEQQLQKIAPSLLQQDVYSPPNLPPDAMDESGSEGGKGDESKRQRTKRGRPEDNDAVRGRLEIEYTKQVTDDNVSELTDRTLAITKRGDMISPVIILVRSMRIEYHQLGVAMFLSIEGMTLVNRQGYPIASATSIATLKSTERDGTYNLYTKE